MGEQAALSSIQLTINGVQYEVGAGDLSPTTSLVEYLRDVVQLTGPKVLCHEGGCSACTVVATAPDPHNPGSNNTFAVHGCQQLLYGCDGWVVETVESLGDWRHGYHPLQTALAGFYGTQCGYCSPGMVMAMYGELQAKGTVTAGEVERALDGNLCRCTGYRPILDAFKSMASDGDPKLKSKLMDIEEAYKGCQSKGKAGGCCGGGGRCGPNKTTVAPSSRSVKAEDQGQWYQPTTLQEVYDILTGLAPEDTFQLVAGNTAGGVYPNWGSRKCLIKTAGVSELYQVLEEVDSVTIGACTSIARAITLFRSIAASNPGFKHLQTVADHWTNVANTGVRNVGSIAGNLMMKNLHPEFPSDLFLTLVGCGAKVTLGTPADPAQPTTIPLEGFLSVDMARGVILSLTLPTLSQNTQIRSYKITPRAVNAHAYVNSVVRLEVDPANNYTITSRPLILYGGINPEFLHADLTEDFLTGHSLSETDLVVRACEVLDTEIIPDAQTQDADPQYRKSLAQALLYKAVLSIQSALGMNVPSDMVSGGTVIERPLSSGQQDFTTGQDNWDVGQPVPKVEALPQVSGEAKYMNDVPALPNELIGVFIQSTQGRATIKSIDTAPALTVPGVVRVVTEADIPGENNLLAQAADVVEQVFASGSVIYAGQALGLVVATSFGAAIRGAQAVVVEYEDIQAPTLTIKDAITQGATQMIGDPIVVGDVQDAFTNSEHIINGEFDMGLQHHFHIETQGARVAPIDDGYDVVATSIWPTEVQSVVAQVLGIDANSVNSSVRRIGGSFGGKINRSHVLVSAAAVAAWHTHTPVRVVLNMSTFMTLIGGRDPFYNKYKVGFNSSGVVSGIEVDAYADSGCVPSDSSASLATGFLTNVYTCPNWLMRPWIATTNTPSNTFMRAPGIVQGISTMEAIMDHIASYLHLDPLSVREANLAATGALRPTQEPFGRNVFAESILPLLKESSSLDLRRTEVAAFNSTNRWHKRGLALMPMCFNIGFGTFQYGIMVNIYAHDGTVAISHGAIEMGQGVNTKVSQIAAGVLGCPLDKVKIKATSTTTNANSWHNGATVCSDIVCNGVKMACERLIARINTFKATLAANEKAADTPWPKLMKLCRDNDIDICERLWTLESEMPKNYDVYGGAVVEVEIDALTGQTQIHRADIIEDCGQSLSPYMDIGQVEGAFVMGLGLMLTEKVRFNPTTGQKVTNSTWSYKPMSAMDIPVDFRVTLLPNSFNDSGVFRAKAVGEPPLVLSYCVVMALREAITAARAHSNNNTDFYNIDTPLTVENVQQLCLVDPSQFTTV